MAGQGRKGIFLVISLIVLVLSLEVAGLIFILKGGSRYALERKIAVVDIRGIIYESREIVELLKRYQSDGGIKAIVLRIDSPGGGVVAAQEVYEAVKRTRTKGKKVVASLGSVAASGGYYMACAADKIVANPGTLTGGIGVIIEFPNLEGLLRKMGLKFEVIKSGKYKDTASLFREPTEEERKLLQELVNDIYNQFVEAIVKGRNLSEEKVRFLADGRVFSGRQAKDYELVDQLGNCEDAIKLAAEIAGIEGEPKVVRERKRRFPLFDLLTELGNERRFINRDYISLLYLYLLK